MRDSEVKQNKERIRFNSRSQLRVFCMICGKIDINYYQF